MGGLADDLCCRDLAMAVRPCEVDPGDWFGCQHRSMFRRRFALAIRLDAAQPLFSYINYCPWCGARLYPSPGTERWLNEALEACLEALVTDTIYIAPDKVEVLDSWTEGLLCFCVVYRHPWSDDIKIGYRATYQAGNPASYDAENPTLFGEYASSSILEPLGSVRDRLRFDANGVGWHGDFDSSGGAS